MTFDECKDKLTKDIMKDIQSMLAGQFHIYDMPPKCEKLMEGLINARLHYQVLTFSKETK